MCHAPLQAGHSVTTKFETAFSAQPRWLLDGPVNPRIKFGEGDDTHLEAVILRDVLTLHLGETSQKAGAVSLDTG